MFVFAILAATLAIAPSPAQAPRAPEAAHTQPLAGLELDGVRGGDAQAVVMTEQNLNAVTSGQIQATVVSSGAVNIDGAALSNFDGIGNFVMNTGNLNSIQSSLSVTIITAPTPGL